MWYVTQWVAFVSVGMGVVASQMIPLSVLARNPHKGLASEIFHRRERGKEGPRENRRRQSTEEGTQQKPVDRAGQSAEESRCKGLWTQRPGCRT